MALAANEVGTNTDLVAQSMGGAVAIGLALNYPHKVRRLVLVATSGGLDVTQFDATDWRAEYRSEYPDVLALLAIVVAWLAGSEFVGHLTNATSLTMGLATAAALLCYVVVIAVEHRATIRSRSPRDRACTPPSNCAWPGA